MDTSSLIWRTFNSAPLHIFLWFSVGLLTGVSVTMGCKGEVKPFKIGTAYSSFGAKLIESLIHYIRDTTLTQVLLHMRDRWNLNWTDCPICLFRIRINCRNSSDYISISYRGSRESIFGLLLLSTSPIRLYQRWDIFRRKKSSAGLNFGVPAGASRRTGLVGARRRRNFLDFTPVTPVGGPQNASYMS